MLNERAREKLVAEGVLGEEGVMIGEREFRVGDRVIARRNDRHRNVDNGTLATVRSIDARTGIVHVLTDSGEERELDAPYVTDHMEHAYALTGHGAHGATVEWAGVIGRPSEFTREWAYTALSRARGRTRAHVIAQVTAIQCEREEYAPPEPARTQDEALETITNAMKRREAEPLAIDQLADPEMPQRDGLGLVRTPATELPEAVAELATREMAHLSGQADGPLSRRSWLEQRQRAERDGDRLRGGEQ